MDFDDFDDWEHAVVVGSFFNEMMEEESQEDQRKRKKDNLPSDPEDVNWGDSNDETNSKYEG